MKRVAAQSYCAGPMRVIFAQINLFRAESRTQLPLGRSQRKIGSTFWRIGAEALVLCHCSLRLKVQSWNSIRQMGNSGIHLTVEALNAEKLYMLGKYENGGISIVSLRYGHHWMNYSSSMLLYFAANGTTFKNQSHQNKDLPVFFVWELNPGSCSPHICRGIRCMCSNRYTNED